MAQEFKTCMGMLKIPDCLKFVVRHDGHYHMVLFSNTSIYSRNAYKKAVGETFKRLVASSTRNTKAAPFYICCIFYPVTNRLLACVANMTKT